MIVFTTMSMHERDLLLHELHVKSQNHRLDGDNYWNWDQVRFPHPDSPEMHTFRHLLGENNSFQKITDKRRRLEKPTNILELFGSAEFLHDSLSADSLTGVRLRDAQYTVGEQKARQRPAHHIVIEGDLYDERAWNDVSSSMESRNIPAFDIAVCAPGGSWGMWERKYPLPVFLSVYYPMMQNAYDLLSSDNGVLYTEIPPRIGLSEEDIVTWETQMRKHGIPVMTAPAPKTSITRKNRVAQITKRPNSPDTLLPLSPKCILPPEAF